MPAVFNKLGISFQYPENWTLDDEDALAGRQAVTVYAPGGGFWTVSLHPPSTDPHQLAKTAVEAMGEEYPEIEVEATTETIDGLDLVGFDLNFYYLDMVNSASVRCLRVSGGTYAFFCQAEGRDFERIEPVFRAMTASTIRTAPPEEDCL